ncbi:hypothetical protein [Kordia sp.]|uniref:hypothetical protein n=1 Tax=Kordia sp. TaxID=1965332 RepID=UPI003B5B4C9B
MNLSIFFDKDDFDEDETFLKIESETGYNRLLVEISLNDKRWFYDHSEMSANYLMNDEQIGFEELIPYDVQSELYEDPKENKPYILNLNTKLFVDEEIIDSQLSRLYLKKSKDTLLSSDDLDFRPVFFLDSVTDFDGDNDVNATILNDIKEINDPEALKSIEELELQIVSFGKIQAVEVKLDTFTDYEELIELATPISISEIAGNDTKHAITMKLKDNLFSLLDDAISYDVRERQHLILNTEIRYTDLETQEKCTRIQSHLIKNPWCEIMENKVERHITILKNVLNAEFPSWSGEIKDNEMWTSFRINDEEFQYGLKDDEIYLHLYQGQISYDYDFDEVYDEMQKVNKTLDRKFKLIETDNYFNIKTHIERYNLKEDVLLECIKKMITIIELPEVDRLLGTYQEY